MAHLHLTSTTKPEVFARPKELRLRLGLGTYMRGRVGPAYALGLTSEEEGGKGSERQIEDLERRGARRLRAQE